MVRFTFIRKAAPSNSEFFQFCVLKSLVLDLGLGGAAAAARGLLSLGDVDRSAVVWYREVEGFADLHLCADYVLLNQKFLHLTAE